MLLVNTFDVEPWWSTVPPSVSLDEWDKLPDRSEVPLRRFLDLCDENGVECTFFFVGWYAKRFPNRVREVVARGHEVGCHSLFHEDVALLSSEEFVATTREAKKILEDVAGEPVISYRAPSFSLPVDRIGEFFQAIHALGFRIDSSVSTASRIYGGGFSSSKFARPCSLSDVYGYDILEVPVPGVGLMGKKVQLFGGGYFRLAPGFFLDHVSKQESYQVLYLHPHDFDRNLPPIPGESRMMNLRRRLNFGDLDRKLRELYNHADVRSCRQLLTSGGVLEYSSK